VPPQRMWPLASSSGDAGKAIADAPVKIETVYTMPDRDHDYSTSPRVKHVLDVGGRCSLLTRYKPPEGRRPAGVKSSVGRHRTPRKTKAPGAFVLSPAFLVFAGDTEPLFSAGFSRPRPTTVLQTASRLGRLRRRTRRVCKSQQETCRGA
jgi:hypothetical protein